MKKNNGPTNANSMRRETVYVLFSDTCLAPKMAPGTWQMLIKYELNEWGGNFYILHSQESIWVQENGQKLILHNTKIQLNLIHSIGVWWFTDYMKFSKYMELKKKKNYSWKKNPLIIEFIHHDMLSTRARNKTLWNAHWIWISLALGFLLKGTVRLK